MRNTWTSVCLICAGITSAGYAQERDPATQAPTTAKSSLTPAEVQILNQLHASNLKEIAASKIAVSRGRVQGVKNLGQVLIKHHSKADHDLQALASRAGVKLSEPAQDEGVGNLKKTINPANFDRAFLDQISAAHETAIAQVGAAQGIASNPDLLAMLKNLLPVLQQHREQALQLLQSNPF